MSILVGLISACAGHGSDAEIRASGPGPASSTPIASSSAPTSLAFIDANSDSGSEPSANSTTMSKPKPTESQVVNNVINAVGPAAFVTAKLAKPTTPDAPGQWFYATLAIPAHQPRYQYHALWLGYVAQGAISATLASSAGTDAFATVSGSAFTFELPNGDTVNGDGGSGKPFYKARSTPLADSQISTEVAQTLKAFGMSATTTIFHPYSSNDAAVDISVTVPDVSRLAGHVNDIFNAIAGGSENTYESVYLSFSLRGGGPLSILYEDGFVGVGGQWFEPGHDEYGMPHPSPPSGPPSSTASTTQT